MPNASESAPPSLLHIAPTPFFSDRGCHIRIAGIVRSMAENGFANRVVTYHLGYDLPDIHTQRIAPIKAYTKTSAGPSIYKLLADYRLLRLTLKQIRTASPSALHAHLHEGVLIAWLCRLILRRQELPIVADMQGSLVGELETYGFFNSVPFLKWPFKMLEKHLLRSADWVVCSSEHALEKFTRDYPELSHKIRLAQDGADTPAPGDEQTLSNKRQALGIDQDKLCAVYSGALLESKGLDQLQQLILECRELSSCVHFLIIGYPVDELEAFLDEHNLSDMCTLTGRMEFNELNTYLALADVAIDPKKSDAGEGSGKMLNYLANGLPVIAFNTVNNASFLGEEARLCDNVQDMKALIEHYRRFPEERTAVAARNKARFSACYSWQVTQRQLAESYASVKLAQPDTLITQAVSEQTPS